VGLFGVPLVVFRIAGRAQALVDRCPHRNVPLSQGRTTSIGVQCAYHGWTFDGAGACRHVPALGGPGKAGWSAEPAAAIDQDGLVWVALERPTDRPPGLELAPDARPVGAVDRSFDAPLQQVAENILDVPHTRFLHRGLFRSDSGGARRRVRVERSDGRVVACYLDEGWPEGWLGQVFRPLVGDRRLEHEDRFIAPCRAEVVYRAGHDLELRLVSWLRPEADDRTVMLSTGFLRGPPVVHRLARRVFRPLATRVVDQDRAILSAQHGVLRRFGGPRFVSSPADLLGPHITRMWNDAVRGDSTPPTVEERTLWL
jgi:phenylpropionate dioxygenase-like ring-hydroxylating dioxygenase large terminal subunit